MTEDQPIPEVHGYLQCQCDQITPSMLLVSTLFSFRMSATSFSTVIVQPGAVIMLRTAGEKLLMSLRVPRSNSSWRPDGCSIKNEYEGQSRYSWPAMLGPMSSLKGSLIVAVLLIIFTLTDEPDGMFNGGGGFAATRASCSEGGILGGDDSSN